MVTNAVARHLGLKIAVQDLTTVGPALAHSISLASALEPDWPHLEYNSRQYAAAANDDLAAQAPDLVQVRDRKSTRLNSSHVAISYAVFCLKKKTTLNPIAS